MKILIVHASSGLGHKKAAESIYDALKKDDGSCQFFIKDFLDYTNPFVSFVYSKVYLFIIKNLRTLWGCIFYITDKGILSSFFGSFRLFVERISTKAFQNYLKKERFDVIISTHFSSSYITGFLKNNNQIFANLITVVTDYRAHSVWLVKESDYFIVAHSKTKEDLQKNNVQESKIKILGIPVGLEFLIDKNPESIMEKLQITKRELTIMVMSGGVGVGPYEYLMKKLLPFKDKVNLLLVCGNNRILYNRLHLLSDKLDAPFKIYQYIDNIDELMQISDIIVTKAGGISLTESLSKRLPMVIVSPIPGQEKLNSELMEKIGASVIAKNKLETISVIKKIMKNPSILEEMRKNIDKIARPKAAEEVARFAKGTK